ncbi:MAG TPA: flippase-like domain-containing protein, partial [Methanotrichaceae archaeon]|nr:flippase-like domain-containing protein [Methanotrichaceae archaeon]
LIPSGSFSGETARVYFLSKIDGASRFDASFASVAASRIITAVPFILGMTLGLAYLIFRCQVPSWVLNTCFVMMIFAVSVVVAFVGICFEERWLQRMVNLTIGPLERIVHRDLDRELCSGAVFGFQRSMHLLRHKNGAMLVSLIWAFAGWLCLEMVAFAAFRSLGFEVSLFAIFAVYSVIIVFQALPLVLPGGIGLVEILMTAIFSAVGISIYDAAAVTILIRLVQLWFLALLGGVSTVHLMRRIDRDRDEPASSGSSADAGI